MASSLVEEEKAQAKGKGRRTKIVGVVPESFSQDYVTNEKVKRLVKAYCQTSNACF
jgi:hypothetical protein